MKSGYLTKSQVKAMKDIRMKVEEKKIEVDLKLFGLGYAEAEQAYFYIGKNVKASEEFREILAAINPTLIRLYGMCGIVGNFEDVYCDIGQMTFRKDFLKQDHENGINLDVSESELDTDSYEEKVMELTDESFIFVLLNYNRVKAHRDDIERLSKVLEKDSKIQMELLQEEYHVVNLQKVVAVELLRYKGCSCLDSFSNASMERYLTVCSTVEKGLDAIRDVIWKGFFSEEGLLELELQGVEGNVENLELAIACDID